MISCSISGALRTYSWKMGLFQCLWCCCHDGWVVCARASEFPRDYDGACLQMRLSYGPAAHFFLFLVRWTDCSLAGALGLLRILIYKVLIVQNAAMMYKSHPHVMSCWPLHHLLLLHISKERLLSSQCLHLDFLKFCVLLQSFHLCWVLLLWIFTSGSNMVPGLTVPCCCLHFHVFLICQ